MKKRQETNTYQLLNITLNFPTLDIPRSQKVGNFSIIFLVLYIVIYIPGVVPPGLILVPARDDMVNQIM